MINRLHTGQSEQMEVLPHSPDVFLELLFFLWIQFISFIIFIQLIFLQLFFTWDGKLAISAMKTVKGKNNINARVRISLSFKDKK
ncbi:MAG TPA: hypothetical protein VET23_15415 [Chitinophagaceae bacterium]|nr:hypothetical protein [Chitinophagaceae bacterium]